MKNSFLVSVLVALLSPLFILLEAKPAYAACTWWTDSNGTDWEKCQWGSNNVEYEGRYRNGTRVRYDCYDWGFETECTYYTNGRRVNTCSFDQFGTSCRR